MSSGIVRREYADDWYIIKAIVYTKLCYASVCYEGN